MTIPYHTTS